MAVPEMTAPAEYYYNDEESMKYDNNSRINKIQYDMTNRALELLNIKKNNKLILDIGCGSGISGNCLEDHGYEWVGMDIAPSMLKICNQNLNATGLLCADIGKPIPFKTEAFEYAICISVAQWLFQSFKTEDDPYKRIRCFFKSLHRIIRKKCVLQVYCSEKELAIFMKEGKVAGFYVSTVIDNKGTKNSKIFIVLDKDKPKTIHKKIIRKKTRQAPVY